MIHDCVVVQSLAEISIDSEGELMESDVVIDDSDEDDGPGERMEGLIVPS